MLNCFFPLLEPLERRVLLANIGLDFGFGDAGFAPAGRLVSDVSGGKILTLGTSGAARLNEDGSPDPTFTDAGAAPGRNSGHAIVSGQRLIIIGRTPDANEIFARAIDIDSGMVDAGFGDGGIATIPVEPAEPGAAMLELTVTSAIVLADGGVVIAVSQSLAGGEDELNGDLLYKLDASGDIDADFGVDGILLLNVGEFASEPNLRAYPGGGFIAREFRNGFLAAAPKPKMTRFGNDGSIDTGFGEGGVVTLARLFPNKTFEQWEEPAVQRDGKVLVAFYEDTDVGSFPHIARFNANGAVDTSFGENGLVSLRAGVVRELTFDAQDRILGRVSLARLFRLTPDGELDLTFDEDGQVTLFREPDEKGNLQAIFLGDIDVDADGRILVGRGADVIRLIEREHVVLAPDNRVHIDGTDGADTIAASLAGDNVSVTFNGQSFTFAADAVEGLVIHASTGDLTADINVDLDALLTSAGDGNASVRTAGGRDWIVGGSGNDTVDAGGGSKDLIFGGYGDDVLVGGDGADKIFGESGADILSGGRGDDWLFGGSPFHPEPEEFDYEDLADTIIGGDGRDRIIGNQGNDFLSGNAGPDFIEGHTGADRLRGHGGRDRLYGNSGSDRLHGGAQGDWLYGQGGNDRLNGDGGNDRLYGDHATGIDTLYGGTGNDILIAGDAMIDHLFGGRGNDATVAADEDDVIAGIESLR